MNLNARIHPFANRLNRREILKGTSHDHMEPPIPPTMDGAERERQRQPQAEHKPQIPPPVELSCSIAACHNDSNEAEAQFTRAIHLLNLAVKDLAKGNNGFIFAEGKLSTKVCKGRSSSRRFATITPVRIIVFDDAVVLEDSNGEEPRQGYLDYIAGSEGSADETVRCCKVMHGLGNDTVVQFSGAEVRNRIVDDVCRTYLPSCLSAAYPEGVVVDGVWCRGAAAASSTAARWSAMTNVNVEGRRLGGSTPPADDDVRAKRLHHLTVKVDGLGSVREAPSPPTPVAPVAARRASPRCNSTKEAKGDVIVLTPVGKYHFCRRSVPEAWRDLIAWLVRELRASGHQSISEEKIVLRRPSIGFNVIDDYTEAISNSSQVIRCSFTM